MNYYVDPNTSELYAYDDEQVEQGFVLPDLVPCEPRPSRYHFWKDGWVIDPEQKAAAFADYLAANTAAIQAKLDQVAQAKGYDNAKSAALRAGYPGPFQAEGIAYATWMDDCWAQAYAYLARVEAGQAQMPTPEEAVAMMPEFTWPAQSS